MKRIFVVLILCLLSACSAKEKADETVGMTGVVLNYSEEDFPSVSINGHTVGTVVRSVKIGDVYGGGAFMCCFPLPAKKNRVDVTLQLLGGEKVVVSAEIEHPLPEIGSIARIHILPGRKIVIDVSAMMLGGVRLDLLDARIKELGLKREVDYQAKLQAIMKEQQQPQPQEEVKPFLPDLKITMPAATN